MPSLATIGLWDEPFGCRLIVGTGGEFTPGTGGVVVRGVAVLLGVVVPVVVFDLRLMGMAFALVAVRAGAVSIITFPRYAFVATLLLRWLGVILDLAKDVRPSSVKVESRRSLGMKKC